jgi:tRNA A37 threonylcarbamoyladenosine dehydratase
MEQEITNSNIERHLKSQEYENNLKLWAEPRLFKLDNDTSLRQLDSLFEDGEIRTVVDNAVSISNDLFELQYPSDKDDEIAREQFNIRNLDLGVSFGTWVYFPWSKSLVRFPDKDDLRSLRTSRNRALITEEEQKKLYDSTIAVFGLSVGSNVVERLVSSGIGGKLIIGDMDTIEPSNLNRINNSFLTVGAKKVHALGQKISEIDPYIEQIHLENGVSQEELNGIVTANKPDVIVDEIDDLTMKVELRSYAQQNGIPLIMATDVGDKSLIDVERYDLPKSKTKPFHGKISQKNLDLIKGGKISEQERAKILVKIVGLTNTTPRLVESAMKQGTELAGLPQLGSTATIGGAFVTIATREILLGRKMKSGRSIVGPKNILDLESPTKLWYGVRTLGKFALKKSN